MPYLGPLPPDTHPDLEETFLTYQRLLGYTPSTILIMQRRPRLVKALALGAHAVLIGRATLYGVAAGGHAGAERAIALLREEVSRVMALLGVRSLDELGPDYLHFTDEGFRRSSPARADLKLLDTARAAEG